MSESALFYLAAVPAVILLGLSKGGFSGVGNIAVPLITLVVSPVQSASLLLPILIVQDAVSVWAFRRTWDGRILGLMLPCAALGIVFGYFLAARVSVDAVEFALGVISIVFGLRQFWVSRRKGPRPAPAPAWYGALCGVVAGFTSQIAHAGGPPFQMYVMPKNLPRDVFVGTSALFFAAVNWMKVPAYVALGQLTVETLKTSAVLLPVAIASTWAGVWLVRRFSSEKFYQIAYGLLVAFGIRLVWSGGARLFGWSI